MINGFRREFPASVGHRVLAVDLDVRDPVIGRVAVIETELPVKIYLDESAHVGLLCLVQLVIFPSPGALPVIQLIERVPEHHRHLIACRIQPVKLRLHRVKLDVGIVGRKMK